ncbi:E3 ubiquitin-protein ligase TRIM39-like isoform X2 [Astyanax mexicanus]|uniref:E3 ubiquitin-protein ligase TRIM39-like isoform X2 n=1 Tax=Astyanax mexicanus TaxID=7994 RepID=UPI0020CAD066|nr:E3 ubiquitin-protein ligase TRIM39-like isoform X2 [Astyanax mexicanus]
MASSIPILSEDQLLCSICLDVFTDPVSTPCGHNFCKSCLTGHWDNSDRWKCPLCNKIFENRPDLSVNTFISETATLFKKSVEMKAKKAAEENPNNPTKVTCDACTGPKMKSVKMCLNCGISYCETHLEPHKNIPILKKHTLIDPVENLVDYICKKHEKPLELFCRDDQTCVCLLCTVTDHKTHNTVPIEEESEEMKTHMKKTQTDLQKMIQHRLEKTEKIKESLELSKKSTEDETAGGVEVFTDLVRSIERSQAELLKSMEEKRKAAERQAEEFIKDLEQEITELKRRDTELEQLSHTEDHLHLLQIYPSLCSPPHTTNWTDISLTTHSSVEILRTSLSQLQKTLNKEFDKELQKLKRRSQKKAAGAGAVNWLMKNWMMVLSLLPLFTLIFIFLTGNIALSFYTVDVTLDPDTAHPKLILSDDGKQVRYGYSNQNRPYNPKRFDYSSAVLGKKGYSSGRFYYEVQVRGTTNWFLGVARESVNRKAKITLKPQNGFWTVWLRNGNEYYAAAGPSVLLSLRENLQKVGVFVDYEEGLVSFYDVEAGSHIYSFTGQSFTEKLYPFFSPGHGNTPLIMSN